jgi:hypothetical protein
LKEAAPAKSLKEYGHTVERVKYFVGEIKISY